jgi:FkbM family methyltransferase
MPLIEIPGSSRRRSIRSRTNPMYLSDPIGSSFSWDETTMPSASYHISGLRKAIGAARTLDVLTRRFFRRRGVIRASLRGWRGTIEIDPLDSDLFVVAQIFGHKEYALDDRVTGRLNEHSAELRKAGRVPVIIDGGANVGYSALFFAETYPEALVVALEPGQNAVASLKRNVADQPRVRSIHAALWSHTEGVRLHSTAHGNWGHFVGDGEDGELTPSVTLHSPFAENPEWEPLIVKLDIEGAEKTVVAASPDVFRSAACIIIEPHDFKLRGAACLAPLFRALADRPMDTLINRENLILLDPRVTAHI